MRANRACMFLKQVGSDVERANYSDHIVNCDRSVELFTKLYITYQTRGVSFVKQGRHEEGSKALLDAMEYHLKLARAYCRRGTACYQLGEYEKAFSDFNKTVEMEPENVVALHNRGCANNRLGRPREAESDFMRALGLSTDLATAYADPEVFTRVSVDEDDLVLILEGGPALGADPGNGGTATR